LVLSMTSPTAKDASHAKFPERNLSLDAEGFLKHLSDWDESVAVYLAENENIKLEEAQWEVIYLLRAFYQSHQIAPANRALVSLVRREFGADKGQSRYLMGLFGGSPAKTAAKVAGLPRPENCL
jgi:tRNA 2-thiouridine synthesizing protein E